MVHLNEYRLFQVIIEALAHGLDRQLIFCSHLADIEIQESQKMRPSSDTVLDFDKSAQGKHTNTDAVELQDTV